MSEEIIKTVDRATKELIDKAERENIKTVFSRSEEIRPCPIGIEESCCKICAMGHAGSHAQKKIAIGRG